MRINSSGWHQSVAALLHIQIAATVVVIERGGKWRREDWTCRGGDLMNWRARASFGQYLCVTAVCSNSIINRH